MIVPMQKATLFISARHQEEALRELRKIGVVHIQHIQPPQSDDIAELESALRDTEKCRLILENTERPLDMKPLKRVKAEEVVSEVLDLMVEKQQLVAQIAEQQNLIEWFESWGRVSAADMRALQEKSIFIRLYNTDKSVLNKLPEGTFVEIIQEEKNLVKIALISESADIRLDIKEALPPQENFETVTKELAALKVRLEDIALRLGYLTAAEDDLRGYQDKLEKNLEFARVKYGMQSVRGADSDETVNEIVYLQGYCPEEKIENLFKAAEKNGWGILAEEPELTDNPPTLLKMSRWTAIIKPVFDFLGTVPGYREYDISKYFLMFFALFVAMIIGDAGYGFIFLLICIFAHHKSAKSGKSLPLAIKLFYVLSATTIAWGTITGNWFGAVQIAALPVFKALTIPQLATFPELFPELTVDPQQKVMFICFVIAITQLSLANIMNFFNALPELKSIAHLGWLTMMAGLFLVVLNLVLGMAMPGFTVPLIVGGLLLIIIFMKQEKGIGFLKGVLAGLGGAFNTFLDSISSFSNIISYIRLFAVGMATVAIASSFNNIAAPMMKGFAFPAAILVLLIGHGLNIVMGLLSVVVHGIRLNVLEFSGQLGMEWNGYKYQPFSDKPQDITEGEIE